MTSQKLALTTSRNIAVDVGNVNSKHKKTFADAK